MTDLFTSAGVDVPPTPKGVAYPATYQAARLLGMVEALRHCAWALGLEPTLTFLAPPLAEPRSKP